MFQVFLSSSPTLARWQSRLARVPRWAWIAFFIGFGIPLLIILAAVVVSAILCGLVFLAAVHIVRTGFGLVYRLLHRDPAPHGEIIVRAVRIVDP
jgi:hypothetical protein